MIYETILSTNALINLNKQRIMVRLSIPLRVYVEAGDKVKTGDVLLSYDIKDYENAVPQAQICMRTLFE